MAIGRFFGLQHTENLFESRVLDASDLKLKYKLLEIMKSILGEFLVMHNFLKIILGENRVWFINAGVKSATMEF